MDTTRAIERATWTEEDQARYIELARNLYDAEPLADYIGRVNPKYPPPRHLDRLISLLERTRYESVFAVVSMPPRHRKTTTVSNALAWRMGLDPFEKHAYATYNDQKARKESRLIRRIAQTAGVPLEWDRQSLREWHTKAGGGLRATSVRGGLTGEGVTGILVIDDPVKDRKEADSPQIREDTWEWFTDVALTRMEPGSSIIVVMTRWHEDDLAGRLLAGGFNEALEAAGQEPWQWEHIELAALCIDENDGTDRKLGEALWPEAYPASYHERRKAINPWSFEALYQQRPRPKFGQLFKSPARFDLDLFLRRGFDGFRLVIGVDPAASDSTKADHWAAVLMAARGYGDTMEAWILDLLHFQADPIAGADRIYDFQVEWGGIDLAFEGGAIGKAPIASLKRQHGDIVIVEVTPDTDKWTRAQPAAAAWNHGRLAVPLRAEWARRLMKQCKDFRGKAGGDDDIVDAIAHAWNTLVDVESPGGDLDFGPRVSPAPAF